MITIGTEVTITQPRAMARRPNEVIAQGIVVDEEVNCYGHDTVTVLVNDLIGKPVPKGPRVGKTVTYNRDYLTKVEGV